MAYNDSDFPGYWDDREKDMFDDLVGGEPELIEDKRLQDLFDDAFFNDGLSPDDRHDAREELKSYFADEYGLDFNAEFDYESYREWYDSTH